MSTCTLNWYTDRGFELDLEAEDDEVSLRMVSVPIPVDGTAELAAGPIQLDRLEILFKAQVDVQGEPGQLQEARVQLVEREGRPHVELFAKVEDVETGDLIPLTACLPVQVPAQAPVKGGPRPKPPDEDELDWEDETTLEQMIVNAPESSGRDTGDDERPKGGGLKALLDALANLGDPGEEAEEEPPLPSLAGLVGHVETPPPPSPEEELEEPEPSPEGPGDQRISAYDEAAGLLQLLIDRDGLELEDDFGIEDLVSGVMDILAGPTSAEAKAGALSAWLLEQPAVADLYLADEDLAEILEQW